MQVKITFSELFGSRTPSQKIEDLEKTKAVSFFVGKNTKKGKTKNVFFCLLDRLGRFLGRVPTVVIKTYALPR